jgi:hypothetical protein
VQERANILLFDAMVSLVERSNTDKILLRATRKALLVLFITTVEVCLTRSSALQVFRDLCHWKYLRNE